MTSPTYIDLAVQVLNDNLAALPSDDYGVINMLPFAHDSEQTRTVKRQVCEAIIKLLDSNDMLQRSAVEPEPLVHHDAVIQCRLCGELLVQIITNENGVGLVHPSLFITSMAQRNPQCPHGPITLDDMRQHMQNVWDQEEAEQAEVEADVKAAKK